MGSGFGAPIRLRGPGKALIKLRGQVKLVGWGRLSDVPQGKMKPL